MVREGGEERIGQKRKFQGLIQDPWNGDRTLESGFPSDSYAHPRIMRLYSQNISRRHNSNSFEEMHLGIVPLKLTWAQKVRGETKEWGPDHLFFYHKNPLLPPDVCLPLEWAFLNSTKVTLCLQIFP